MSDRASSHLASHLLGRHVADRAQHGPGLGRGGGRREAAGRLAALEALELGEAEVEDLHAAVPGDEDVLGLEIAVDDAVVVGGRQAVGDLHRVLERLARGQGPVVEPLAQRLALEQLRDEVERPASLPTS